NDSQETIIQAVTPVLDQLIEKRSLQEAQKMAVAIAKILPSAITDEINLVPEAIARAIAPEIAIAIREQIRLDDNAISQTLGPEMGKAIKAQIELERDAMVDALYPVIGSTISKYMVEVVQAINSKVENTLSPEGIKRKIRAKIQGVSEAELIFQESVGCQVQAVFLIDKDSGVVIQEVQPGEQHLNSDMIAGMLTAIRSFANDCIASGSELDAIDYGDWQIPIEVAGYCYLAVVLKGEPTKGFRTKIRQVLGDIVLKHGKVIEKYEGNMATIPLEIKSMLEQLIEVEIEQPVKSSSPLTVLCLLTFILGLILIPWGIVNYRARVAHQIEEITAIKLDAAPELSVYRLEPQVRKGILTIEGRVPSEYL
ncbi:MAG: flagellar motor protein MotB, partial [Waterburya sp.]